MHWLILFVAGLFEIAWAMGLKYTHGFTRLDADRRSPSPASWPASACSAWR